MIRDLQFNFNILKTDYYEKGMNYGFIWGVIIGITIGALLWGGK